MSKCESPGFRFPFAVTALFGLIVPVAALIRITPVVRSDREPDEAIAKKVPVAGSFAAADVTPHGVSDGLPAPIASFHAPVAPAASAIDLSLSVPIRGAP